MVDMEHFDPLDDEDLTRIEEGNRLARERMDRERAERDAHHQACAMLRGQISDWLRAGRPPLPGSYPNAQVRILPKGTHVAPSQLSELRHSGGEASPDWQPHDMRFWDGFEGACLTTPDELRRAGRELVSDFGSFDEVLALCAPETRSRWQRVVDGYNGKGAAPGAARWGILLSRGLMAIRSEAEYRRGLSSS